MRTGCVPDAYRMHTGCVPDAYLMRTGCVPNAYHPGLCHAGGHDADAAHGGVVVRPVHNRVGHFWYALVRTVWYALIRTGTLLVTHGVARAIDVGLMEINLANKVKVSWTRTE